MAYMTCREGDRIHLCSEGSRPERVHVFSDREILAVDAALAAKRPLLLRGEPGIGKSQLAEATAVHLKRAFVRSVVDSRTEARDLLWHFDAIARLADAQLQGALGNLGTPDNEQLKARKAEMQRELAVEKYIHPRALWWGFSWSSARTQALSLETELPPLRKGCDPENGTVVLIDEIDKAETDVPNGLLEALGEGCFQPQGWGKPIETSGHAPLVMITTNGERDLPDAFIRRCVVLQLNLPTKRKDLTEHLVSRGKAHFFDETDDLPEAHLAVLVKAAEQLANDREKAIKENWLPFPGQAEYLDLIRAVRDLVPNDPAAQEDHLDRLAEYILRKHPGAPG